MPNSNAKPEILEVVLGIVKNKANKVLIYQRTRNERLKDNMQLTWVFPGGKIHPGETKEEAVARELKQETGYTVEVKEFISERTLEQPKVHLYYYHCEISSPKTAPIQDIHEVKQVKWVDVSELKNYFTSDMDRKVEKFLGI